MPRKVKVLRMSYSPPHLQDAGLIKHPPQSLAPNSSSFQNDACGVVKGYF